MKYYCAAWIAIVGLPIAANAGEYAKPITVQFDLLKSRHMVVQIKINGKGPYRVIFDTGAPVNLINNRVAKESGILPKNYRPPFFALFGASSQQHTIKSLQVGDVKASNLGAIVMNHPTIDALARVLGPIEGIIGFSFFARYDMTLDYQAKTMTFRPGTFQPKENLTDDLMKTIMANRSGKQIVAPKGQWGFRATKDADDKKPGVTIAAVFPGSSAASAGLKKGDRLLTLDGRWTDTPADCYDAASFVPPGETVELVVRREGKQLTLRLTVAAGL